jgi:hypothetical protein
MKSVLDNGSTPEASAAEAFYRAETAVKGSPTAKIQLKLGHRFG